jgi:hypothetical protein
MGYGVGISLCISILLTCSIINLIIFQKPHLESLSSSYKGSLRQLRINDELSNCISNITFEVETNKKEKVCSTLKCDFELSKMKKVSDLKYILTNKSLSTYTMNHNKMDGWMSFRHHDIGNYESIV